MKIHYGRLLGLCLVLYIGYGVSVLGAAPPSWQVRVADFQYSMTVTALLKVNASYSTDQNDLVSAVVGSQIRGVGYPQIWVSGTGQRLLFMQVYSNTVSGENMSFQIYDASQDQVIQAVSATTFQSNQAIGSVASPFLVTDNYGPETVLLSNQKIDENASAGTQVGLLSSQDQDGGTFSFALVSGEGDTDNASFQVSGNRLLSQAVFDYESKHTYKVRLRATDDKNEYTEKTFSISIQDKNDAPTRVQLSANKVPEHSELGTEIGLLSAQDEDINASSYVYSFVSLSGEEAPHNELFLIEGNKLKTKGVFNYEAKSAYVIHVRATDTDGLYCENKLQIAITDENDTPTAIHMSKDAISEHSSSNGILLNLSATDPDPTDTHSFGLLNESTPFAIQGKSLVLLSALNYETQSLYFLTLRVTDSEGSSLTQTLPLRVIDANDTPTALHLSKKHLEENLPTSSLFALLSSTDEDANDTFSYTLVAGTGDNDNNAFYIAKDSLRTSVIFNYETKSTYKIRLRTTDKGGDHFTNAYTVNVTDVSDPITDIAIGNATLQENSLPGTTVGSFSISDEDLQDQHTLTLVSGTGDDDNTNFVVQGMVLKNLKRLDYETQSTHKIRVRATDVAGNSYEEPFVISLIDENELPDKLALSKDSVNENSTIGTTIGTISTLDVDMGDTFTYALEDAADTHRFRIEGDQLLTNEGLNYEKQIFYTIKISSTDQGNNKRIQSFVIRALDVNENPTGMVLSKATIPENIATDTPIGFLRGIDPDLKNTFTYSLANVSGDYDQSAFVVKQNSLRNAVVFNYEAKNAYKVRLKVVDGGGLSFEKDFSISISNVNEAPTALALNSPSVAENQPVETWVGRFTTSDPDANNQFQYRLIKGEDADHNHLFLIKNDQLYTAEIFDYETKNSYKIRVKTQDAGGLAYENPMVIAITDANDAPTNILLSSKTVPENTPKGYVVGYLSVEDPDDTVSPITYQIQEISSPGAFEISGNQVLSHEVLDYETQRKYLLRVEASDKSGHRLSRLFTLEVLDRDDPATGIRFRAVSLKENSPRATQAGELSILDVDSPTEAYQYTFADGENNDDNALFYLVNHRLYTYQPLNYEQKKAYKVRVRATHTQGAKYGLTEAAFLVNISDVNDAPSAVHLSSTEIEENKSAGTLIGTLSSLDEDIQDAFVYTLHGDASVLSLFNIAQGQLYSLAPFDAEIKDVYEFELRTTDKGGKQATTPFTIRVLNVNDPPVFENKTILVDENSPAGTAIATLRATDPDQNTIRYAMAAHTGTPNANQYFSIEAATGVLRVQDPAILDYERTKTLKVQIRATDNGSPVQYAEHAYTIKVQDVPEETLPAAMAMSPNGDGVNDYWTIENVELYKDMELVIFNSRGNIVYQKVGYANDWDGRYNHQPLPQGVYYYVFKRSDGSIAYRGSISILH